MFTTIELSAKKHECFNLKKKKNSNREIDKIRYIVIWNILFRLKRMFTGYSNRGYVIGANKNP